MLAFSSSCTLPQTSTASEYEQHATPIPKAASGPPAEQPSPRPAAQLSLRDLYPEFADMSSMADVLTLAQRHLQTNVVAKAAAAARAHFDAHPEDKIDVNAIADATAEAFKADSLLHFLQAKADAIEDKVQPDIRCLIPPPDQGSSTSIPSYPTDLALELIDTYHSGARVVWPGPLPLPPSATYRIPSDDESIAMQRLISEEVKKGILVLLTWDDLLELANDQGVEVHASPTNLVGKSDDPKARKADDYTRGDVNSKDKGKVLEATHGPYNDPNCASLCTQYYVAKAAFPNQPILMLKSDYSAYFKRIPVNIHDVLKLVTRVTIDGVVYAAIPLTHPFGLQDSNAHAKTLTEVMHAINRAFDLEKFGVSLRTTYVDDTVAFGPVHVLQLIRESQIVTADRVIGPHGTNLKKTEIASILTVLGYLFDLEAETVGLTSIWFTKLVCTLFHEIPAVVAVKQPVPLHQLQRTAAYMLRSSTIIRGMKPFSHGIYRNIRGIPPAYTGSVSLTPDAVTDIREWRAFILSLWDNASPLRCPMSIPPLLHRLPGQDRVELWQQQAAHAHDLLHVDASGLDADSVLVEDEWGGGWVASYPDGRYSAYGEYVLQRLSLYLDPVSFGDVDQINILEFLIALVAIDELTRRGRPAHLPPDAVWHIHCWTDNTTALSWLTKHKSSHPLVIHLLHVYTRLQVDNHMLLTMGHIPGVRNVVADTLSRQYQTPEGDMVRQLLSHLAPHSSLPAWWPSSEMRLTPLPTSR